jgi:hypothetical protein
MSRRKSGTQRVSRRGILPWGKLQMPKDKNSRTQHKAVRSYIKRAGAAACALAVVGALAYFRSDLPFLNLSSVDPHATKHDLPSGSILIPYDDGLCYLHAIDNATGHIRDYGLVNCLDASDQNSAAWKSMVDQLKATEIRKSFRHQ